ncbi:MAG: hydrogenase maturation protease [Acidobacteriaceae bacterium]
MTDSNSKCSLKVLVLGLGNVLMSDEGVGVHVVHALETHALPPNVECLDGGTGGFVLLEPMQNADRIVMIDAAADGNPIGTVTRTVPRFSRDYPPTLTAHDVGIKDLLDLFYMLDGGREVTLYAISINPQQPISLELSSVIEKAANEAVERILGELAPPAGCC